MRPLLGLDELIKRVQEGCLIQLARSSPGPSFLSPGQSGCIPHPSRTVPDPAHPHTLSLALAGLAQKHARDRAHNLSAHAVMF